MCYRIDTAMSAYCTHISSQIPQHCVELGDQLQQSHGIIIITTHPQYLEDPSSVGARGEQGLDQLAQPVHNNHQATAQGGETASAGLGDATSLLSFCIGKRGMDIGAMWGHMAGACQSHDPPLPSLLPSKSSAGPVASSVLRRAINQSESTRMCSKCE